MLALPLVLVGCTSDDGKKPTVLPSLAPPAASPSAVPVPSVPPEASAETAQGASAFVRYYLDVVNRSFATGEAAPVQALSMSDCAGCRNLIQAISAPTTANERVEGGDYKVLEVASTPASPQVMSSLVTYSLTEVRVVDAVGTLVRSTPARPPVAANMTLQRTNGSWLVATFRNVQS